MQSAGRGDVENEGFTWIRLSLVGTLLVSHQLKLLHPFPPVHLAGIDVPFGVHRNRVDMSKLAQLVTDAPEASDNLPAGVIEDVDFLVVFITDIHELLILIGREGYLLNRACRCVRHVWASIPDPDVPLK